MRDVIVEEVRRARKAYAAKHGHNLDRIVDDLKRRQDQGEFEVVRRRPRPARKSAHVKSKRSA
jgi:hypothetical protein